METTNVFEKRKEMYKKLGPKWKDQYRKRCHERLKKSRDKFLDKFRHSAAADVANGDSVVKGLMVEEWRVMCTEHKELPSLAHTNAANHHFEFDLRTEENLDEVMYVFEEIRLELLKEEQEILREYEAGCYYDEQALHAAVNAEESPKLICPVCQKNPLFVNKGIFFCSCGVRVDTEQDCMSLEHVRSNIEEATHTHGEVCEARPGFSVISHVQHVHNLIMTCQTCDYMHIIV